MPHAFHFAQLQLHCTPHRLRPRLLWCLLTL
jgi:hypothetical protein